MMFSGGAWTQNYGLMEQIHQIPETREARND